MPVRCLRRFPIDWDENKTEYLESSTTFLCFIHRPVESPRRYLTPFLPVTSLVDFLEPIDFFFFEK